MTGPASPLETAGIVGILTTLGGAVAWAWKAWFGRADKRQKALDEQEERLNLRIESLMAQQQVEVAALRNEVNIHRGMIDKLNNRSANQHTAIHLLVAEVARVNPDAPVLLQIERLLGEDWHVLPTNTREFSAMLHDIDVSANSARQSVRKRGKST